MIKFFAAFFAFGTAMCVLTVVLLFSPGTELDSLWRLNPDAHATFQSIGKVAVLLMAVVGTACAFAAIGLWRNSAWVSASRWLFYRSTSLATYSTP
jgi:hypothetical protein